jgi:hypothetical protein
MSTEDEEVIARFPEFDLLIAGQVATVWRSEDHPQSAVQGPALRGQG